MLAILISAVLALPPNSTPFGDGRPPAAFQHDATVTLEFAGQQRIDEVCHPLFGDPPKGLRTQACDTGARVVMPNPCTFPDTDRYAHLLCHELGHVNGWPSTHGDVPPPTPVSAQRPSEGAPPAVGAAAGAAKPANGA